MISFVALYMSQVLHAVDFLGSRRMETAPTSIEVLLRPTQSQSDEPSDLRGSLSPTSVYSTGQSQNVTLPIMNRARRCLTSVIEHKPLSERRIPYSVYSVFRRFQIKKRIFPIHLFNIVGTASDGEVACSASDHQS